MPSFQLGEKLYRSLTSYANIEESMKLASLPSIDVNYMDSQVLNIAISRNVHCL